jgi:hypothetical protein
VSKDDEIFLDRKTIARRCYPRQMGQPLDEPFGEVFDEPFDDWTARAIHAWEAVITKQNKAHDRLLAYPGMPDFVRARLEHRMDERLPKDERGKYRVTGVQADLFISNCVDPLPGRFKIPRNEGGKFIKREP